MKSLWNTSSEALENLGKIHRLVGFILVLSLKSIIFFPAMGSSCSWEISEESMVHAVFCYCLVIIAHS